MDIDSDDDPSTEPEDDTDVEVSAKHICIPHTSKRDKEEMRIVRNNFAEEYDPWDISMVPEYAEDIFRYMRELEVCPLLSPSVLFNPHQSTYLTIVSHDAESELHGESTRIRLAYASRPDRLVNSSPRSLPPSPRNPLSNSQHNRPLPNPPQRPSKQTPTCRRNSNLHGVQIRRNHMSLRRGNRLHGRQRICPR